MTGNMMNPSLLLLLLVAALARADKANNVAPEKVGSYQESYFDGESFVVKDVVEEGDLEFYGLDAKPDDKIIDEDDEELEILEFIHDLFETSSEAKYVENLDDILVDTLTTHDTNLDQRDLIINLPAVYCECPSQIYYFNIEIQITPSYDARLGLCSAQKRRRLGNHINRMLFDLGVGDAGKGDNVVFVVKVCNNPDVFRRLLVDVNHDELEAEEHLEMDKERELALKVNGFLYSGGGPCRGCPGDNLDRRKLASTSTSTLSMSCSGSNCVQSSQTTNCVGSQCTHVNYFCQASGANNCGCNLNFYDFLQDLNNRVKDYLKTRVVPRNFDCCGSMPGISVTTSAVSSSDVKFGC